jgi:hypothetical protein
MFLELGYTNFHFCSTLKYVNHMQTMPEFNIILPSSTCCPLQNAFGCHKGRESVAIFTMVNIVTVGFLAFRVSITDLV